LLNEVLKKNNLINFFIWSFVPSGRAPLDDFLALEKTLINEGLEISFGALTLFPPVFGGGGCQIRAHGTIHMAHFS
jgi:hypothetical protein